MPRIHTRLSGATPQYVLPASFSFSCQFYSRLCVGPTPVLQATTARISKAKIARSMCTVLALHLYIHENTMVFTSSCQPIPGANAWKLRKILGVVTCVHQFQNVLEKMFHRRCFNNEKFWSKAGVFCAYHSNLRPNYPQSIFRRPTSCLAKGRPNF